MTITREACKNFDPVIKNTIKCTLRGEKNENFSNLVIMLISVLESLD